MEGMRNPDAVTRRLRINSVLNAVTRRGPFVGNFSAVIGMPGQEFDVFGCQVSVAYRWWLCRYTSMGYRGRGCVKNFVLFVEV